MTTKPEYSITGVCVRFTSTMNYIAFPQAPRLENDGFPRFKLVVRIQRFEGFKMYH